MSAYSGVAFTPGFMLQAKGAEVLIALTHMREPNDRKLAAEVPEFHLVLGGHDHHYVSAFIEPHNNLMVKSGTDFRDMSLIEVEFPNGSTTDPKMSVERLVIDGSVPEDPAAKEVRVCVRGFGWRAVRASPGEGTR